MFEIKNKKYFGSALSFIHRLIEHRYEINKNSVACGASSVFYKTVKGDIKNTRFTIIHKIPNFKLIYKLEHPDLYIDLSAGQIEILEAFSLFSIRTLEQLLIDAYPENNLNTRQVYHTYNWDSSKLNKKVSEVYGSNPINVIIFKENEIISSISYNSHSEAKRALGVKTRSLRPYINNTKSYYSLLRIRY